VLLVGVAIGGAGNRSERAQQLGWWQTSDSSQTGRGLNGANVPDFRWRPCLDGDGFGSPRTCFGRAAGWRTRAGFELGRRVLGYRLAFVLRGLFCLDRRLGCGIQRSQLVVALASIRFSLFDQRRFSLGGRGRQRAWLSGLGSASLLDQAGDRGVAGHALKPKKEPRVQYAARRGGQFADRRPTGQFGNRGRSVFLV